MKNTKKVEEENEESVAEDVIVEISEEKLADLIDQLEKAKNKEQRALADYQNLVRRTAEERTRIIKFAAKDFVESLIQPLANLALASKQIEDVGLNMVTSQLWQALESNGLKKIDCIGKKFDIKLMEVVDKGEKGDKVVEVVKEGYLLNDEVIEFAKVVLD